MTPALLVLLAAAAADPPPNAASQGPVVTLEATVGLRTIPAGQGRESIRGRAAGPSTVPTSYASLRVRLAGMSATASVLTDGLQATVTRKDGKTTVALTPRDEKDEKGRPVVPSTRAVGMTTLFPGEVANVTLPFGATAGAAGAHLADAMAAKEAVVVEYNVPEAWGRRYGVVTGKLSCTAAVDQSKADEKPAGKKPLEQPKTGK